MAILEELWSNLQRVKQAVRQNHTHRHTKAVKWLCNGTNCNMVVVQILSLRPMGLPTNGFVKLFVGFLFSPKSDFGSYMGIIVR